MIPLVASACFVSDCTGGIEPIADRFVRNHSLAALLMSKNNKPFPFSFLNTKNKIDLEIAE